MLLGSKFTLFHTYSEDKILSKYIQVGSHVKWPVDSKIATILTSVYTVQKLWTKISAFNKNVQKSHRKLMSKKKDTAWFLTNQKWALYILKRIYKGRICTERIFHIFKIQRVFFFDNKGNCVFIGSILTWNFDSHIFFYILSSKLDFF